MKLKNLKVVLLFIILGSILILQSCIARDKEIVLSNDVAQDIQKEEKQILKYLNEGEEYLKDSKFSEAKESFQAAVDISNSDKEIYIEIKDQYLQFNRFDDAYYFINLAIKNNVDTENMNKILVDIRNSMDRVKVTCDAYVNQVGFSLPEKVKISVYGTEYTDNVVWSDWKSDISETGSYTYSGITKEYGRNVEAQVNIEDFNEKQMGFIRDTYIKDNEIYIVFDKVEFYFGKESIDEAIEEYGLPKDINGNEYRPISYYLRNPDEEMVTFKLSKEVDIKMCAFYIDSKDSTILQVTDYETFKAHIDKYKGDETRERALLFNIDIEHGLGKKLDMQFTP